MSKAGFATDSPTTDDPLTACGERLDHYLVRLGWARSRRIASRLIEDGCVRVNGRRGHKGALITANEQVEITLALESAAAEPAIESKVTLEILHEDDGLIIVNKPALLPCHPLRASGEVSVTTLLARDYPEVARLGAKPFEGGLIHRLDNGTSGALMVARTPEGLRFMREALRAGQIYRRYEALIEGELKSPLKINWPVAHHRKNPARMVIVNDMSTTAMPTRAERIVRAPSRGTPREAASYVEPVAQLAKSTLVNVIPQTGRRHQIRIHLAGIGHPIIGDELYGGNPLPSLAKDRFWLHLAELRFDSPSGKRVCLIAPRPDDLENTLAEARIRENENAPHPTIHSVPGQRRPNL